MVKDIYTKKELEELEPGDWIEWKPKYITYDIYKVNKRIFNINNCSDGDFVEVNVTLSTLLQLMSGKKKTYQLNWQ